MIYVEIDNDDRVVQAMRVPPLADIPGRTDLSFWLSSIIGRRDFKWRGEDIIFASTKWTPGSWIVAEVDKQTGDMVFHAYNHASFSDRFSKVA